MLFVSVSLGRFARRAHGIKLARAERTRLYYTRTLDACNYCTRHLAHAFRLALHYRREDAGALMTHEECERARPCTLSNWWLWYGIHESFVCLLACARANSEPNPNTRVIWVVRCLVITLWKAERETSAIACGRFQLCLDDIQMQMMFIYKYKYVHVRTTSRGQQQQQQHIACEFQWTMLQWIFSARLLSVYVHVYFIV